MPFDPVPQILDDLRARRLIVLVDDEQRENEGDLVIAAQFATPEAINFMVREGRGLLCAALAPSICDILELAPQTPVNTSQLATGYTVTVDAHRKFGISTGISAADRATTVRRLADPAATAADFTRPGHVNPLRARDGGVLVRTGQTEGSVDLCKLADLRPAAAIIEIMNDDGSMARLPELQKLCERHKLKMCSIADVIAYRFQREKLVERIDEAPFDTEFGRFNLIAYRSKVDPLPHVALVKGRVGQSKSIDDPVLVRMHSQNLLGDVFADSGQPTGRTLHRAMKMIHDAGEGAIVYIRQDGMGTGLLQQLQSLHGPAAQQSPELRSAMSKFDFGVGSQILVDLGIKKLRLLTNHPRTLHGLDGFGLTIAEHVPL